MPRPPSRRGPWLLAAVSLGLLLLPSSLSQPPRLWLAAALLPLRATSNGIASLASRLTPAFAAEGTDRVRLEHLQSRNQELAARVMDLQGQIESVSGARAAVVDPKLVLLPADVVVNADSNAWRRSMVLSRGSSHGVARGMLVLWEKHLVGRVLDATPLTCRVMLATDSGFRVGALALPRLYDQSVPLNSRDIGVLEGTGDRACVLKWVSGEAVVDEGATVVTTGDPATAFPRGLLLGRVSTVARGRGPFPKVDVIPFLNPRALDSVVILLRMEKP